MDIRGLIIPLGRCPWLHDQQTLDDAIALFNASCTCAENSPALLPELFVLDAENKLVGRLSRLDILEGLLPNIPNMDRLGCFAGKSTAYPHLTYIFEDHVLAECAGNRTRPICSLMRPVDFTLPADTHILEAILELHRHNASCAPVTEDGTVIGVLRLEELFYSMCNTWCVWHQK